MSRKARVNDLVEVEWCDTREHRSGWEPRRVFARGRDVTGFRSTGYVVRTTKRSLVLAQSVSPERDQFVGGIVIPTSALSNVRRLGRLK